MYIIKLDDYRNLTTTKVEPIYRGDNVENGIRFLVSKKIGPIEDVATAKLYLTYLRPDGVPEMLWLYKHTEYSDEYYKYIMPYNRKFTRVPGNVTLWFQIYSTDECMHPVIMKTNEINVTILPSKDAEEYIDDDSLSLIYTVQKGMEEHVQEKIDELSAKKADNITYREEDESLHLISDGEDLGDPVAVDQFVPSPIKKFWISSSGNLWVTYEDDTSKNIGHVVGPQGERGAKGEDGAPGKVYVPSVSEKKILTWKVEDKEGAIPDPTDLNPSDEWSRMDDERGVQTDYTWDQL